MYNGQQPTAYNRYRVQSRKVYIKIYLYKSKMFHQKRIQIKILKYIINIKFRKSCVYTKLLHFKENLHFKLL